MKWIPLKYKPIKRVHDKERRYWGCVCSPRLVILFSCQTFHLNSPLERWHWEPRNELRLFPVQTKYRTPVLNHSVLIHCDHSKSSRALNMSLSSSVVRWWWWASGFTMKHERLLVQILLKSFYSISFSWEHLPRTPGILHLSLIYNLFLHQFLTPLKEEKSCYWHNHTS